MRRDLRPRRPPHFRRFFEALDLCAVHTFEGGQGVDVPSFSGTII